MALLAYGQPDGAIVQFAYTIADIDRAMADFGARLGVGPWFVMGPFTPPAARYRGVACGFSVSLAFAFSGHVQIELLQQHCETPSALRDRPLGFHHWGIGVHDFDDALARGTAQGDETVFTDQAPDGGRFAYLDSSSHLPGLTELIEMTPEREAMFAMMQKASSDWDGRDPVRQMG